MSSAQQVKENGPMFASLANFQRRDELERAVVVAAVPFVIAEIVMEVPEISTARAWSVAFMAVSS